MNIWDRRNKMIAKIKRFLKALFRRERPAYTDGTAEWSATTEKFRRNRAAWLNERAKNHDR
jgi:hypothetical protein